MAVPIAARDVAAVVGALLVLTAAVSVVGTLIVPRSVASWLTRWVGVIVSGAFNLITSPIASYKQRDRILAAEAATFLLCQLAAWLLISFIGYTLLVWPFMSGGITSAVTLAGPAVFGPTTPQVPRSGSSLIWQRGQRSSSSPCRSPTCPPCIQRSTGARTMCRC